MLLLFFYCNMTHTKITADFSNVMYCYVAVNQGHPMESSNIQLTQPGTTKTIYLNTIGH